MDRMTLVTSVRSNKEELCIELRMNDSPLGHIFFPGSEAESFIQNVANARAQLTEEVPRDLDPNARLTGTDDPVWRLWEGADGSKVLSLRHPGLGWMSFRFPEKEAQSLGSLLAKAEPKTGD